MEISLSKMNMMPKKIFASLALVGSFLPALSRAENYVEYWKNENGIVQYIDMDSLTLVARGKTLVYLTEVGSYPSIREGAAYYISKNLIDCANQYQDQIYWGTLTADKIPLRVKEKLSLQDGIDVALSKLANNYEGRFIAGEMHSLCGIVAKWTYEHDNDANIQPLINATATTAITSVPLSRDGGVYHVKATVNGELTLTFVVDSGASDVVFPQYIGKTLFSSGSLGESDIQGQAKYSLADGSNQSGVIVNLKSLKIGDVTINNVRASIMPADGASILLGQSALKKLGKWQINSKANRLEILGN